MNSRAALLSFCACLNGSWAAGEYTPSLNPPLNKTESAFHDMGATTDHYDIQYRMVPMRDGARLATVIARPRDQGRHPTIMIRTPYTPVEELRAAKFLLKEAISRSYAVVVQNERGSNWSEGEFHMLGGTARDGYDTLSWISGEPWSNGNVGTYGCSSSGENQMLLGSMKHPALKAIIAMSPGAGVGTIPGVVSPAYFYRGGVPQIKLYGGWFVGNGFRHRPMLPKGIGNQEEIQILRNFELQKPDDEAFSAAFDALLEAGPSIDILKNLGLPPTDFEHDLSMSPADPGWKAVDLLKNSDTGVTPAIYVNGWGETGAYEMVKVFEFQQHDPNVYLIMAPTNHCRETRATENTTMGDREVGDGRLPYTDIFMSWYESRLNDNSAAWKPMPRLQTFLVGANTWLKGDHWPLSKTTTARLFLAGGGKANGVSGDGVLRARAPLTDFADRFTADPATPYRWLSKDDEKRRDVLVYTTAPLGETGMALLGDIHAMLYVAADTPDTDIVVRLLDVYPDGTSYVIVRNGMLRLRYRDSFSSPKPLIPGEVYRIDIGEMTSSNYFAPGHRLRIEIAGADFPKFERNFNEGGRNETETNGVIAHIDIHHGGKWASYLEFSRYIAPVDAR